MKLFAALLLIVACEKSGSVETTPGVTETVTAPVGPTPVLVDPRVQTMPSNVVLERAPAHADEPADSPRARRERIADSIAMQDEVMARDFADRLTAIGPTAGDMSARGPLTDLSRQLDPGISGGGRVQIGRGGGGQVGTARIGGLGPADAIGPNPPSPGRVTVLPPSTSSTSSLTPELVLRKVASAYTPGIKRCYKTSLAQDPALRGKLALALKVTATGRAIDPSVTGLTKELDDCIVAQMTSWRFPVPKDQDGEPVDATFQIAIQVVPE